MIGTTGTLEIYRFASQEAMLTNSPVKKLSISTTTPDNRPIFSLSSSIQTTAPKKGAKKRKAQESVVIQFHFFFYHCLCFLLLLFRMNHLKWALLQCFCNPTFLLWLAEMTKTQAISIYNIILLSLLFFKLCLILVTCHGNMGSDLRIFTNEI